MSSMINQYNKENRRQNLQTSASSDCDFYAKNPFLKIQLADSIKVCDSSLQKQSESKEYKFEHKQVAQSMERRFKLQLKKQKELFEIMETKLKQQNNFLFEQSQCLKQQNKQLLGKLKQSSVIAHTSSNQPDEGDCLIVSQRENFRNMLLTLQKEHQNCISVKKELIDKKQTLEMKIMILEKECKELRTECKQLKIKIQSFTEMQNQNKSMKNQVQLLRKQVISLRVLNQQQEKQFSKQLSSLQKAIEQINSKTTFPEISEKLISFANQQLVQTQPQHHFKKGSHPIHSKSQLQSAQGLSLDTSVSSHVNRFFINSFPQNSIEHSALSYYVPNNLDETSIIQGLYKKNLSILGRKSTNSASSQIPINSKISNFENDGIIKTETSYKKLISKIQKDDCNFASLAKQQTPFHKAFGTNRRFKYL